ncbi:peptide chain release factor N(5)-glutamine methyltransferase [Alteraurantiacibacter aestuarii]
MAGTSTVAGVLRAAAQQLAGTSDTARLDAELLMAHALGVSRSDLLLRHMGAISPALLDRFNHLLDRRLRSEPVAYILGYQEFRDLNFAVNAHVLIPRADSETTLQAALDAAPGSARVLDCGTGSGALLLSFLHERPGSSGIGIDASAQALGVAACNCESLGLTGRAQFFVRDWNQPGWAEQLGRFDLILSNPPYVEADAQLDSSVRDFEPAQALFAGPDGLDDYRALIPQLPALLEPGGVAVLEIGATQAGAVTQIATQSGFTVQCHEDLGGRPRALVLRLGLGK